MNGLLGSYRRIRHLHCFTIDHRLILLSLDLNGEHQRWRQNPFWFLGHVIN